MLIYQEKNYGVVKRTRVKRKNKLKIRWRTIKQCIAKS